jgi:hypothetical protein
VRCITVVLLLCGLVFAQAEFKIPMRDSSTLIEPQNLVRRFCEMDGNGFRLNQELAKRVQATTNWQQLSEVTGFYVYSSFELVSARTTAQGVAVTVQYKVLGRYHKGAEYVPDSRVDTVEFHVEQYNGGWRIIADDGLAVPRLSRARAYKWFREQAESQSNPEAKALLKDAATQIQQ